MDDQLVDDSFQQTYQGTVKNGLTIRRLERRHGLVTLRCLASNNNFTLPVESVARVRMLFPPQGARISGPSQPLTAGREYVLSCRVWGSNPPARVEWFRAEAQSGDLKTLDGYNQTVNDGGNVTVAWLRFRPTAEDHGQTISCRGSNEEMLMDGTEIVEDFLRLQVYCEYFSPFPFIRFASAGVTRKKGDKQNVRTVSSLQSVHSTAALLQKQSGSRSALRKSGLFAQIYSESNWTDKRRKGRKERT